MLRLRGVSSLTTIARNSPSSPSSFLNINLNGSAFLVTRNFSQPALQRNANKTSGDGDGRWWRNQGNSNKLFGVAVSGAVGLCVALNGYRKKYTCEERYY